MEWSVDAKDTYLTSASRKSQFLPFAKCTNCHERGHRAARCPQPPIPIRCHMCSQVGHIEANCPNTICLSVSNFNRFHRNRISVNLNVFSYNFSVAKKPEVLFMAVNHAVEIQISVAIYVRNVAIVPIYAQIDGVDIIQR